MTKILQKLFPISLRQKIRSFFVDDTFNEVSLVNAIFRRLTSVIRKTPDFILIGAQKSGTTALYKYLNEHPEFEKPCSKGTYFFDNNFSKGGRWYKSHFPLITTNIFWRLFSNKKITGEFTPSYVYHPHVANRISKLFPKIKLILILRNPIDRTYSHYQHIKKSGNENLSFEAALLKEKERIDKETKKLIADENYLSPIRQRYSYVSRSLYANQLEVWFKYFDKNQLLIIKSEDLFENPEETYNLVLKFLNLTPYKLKQYKKIYAGQYSKIDQKIRRKLQSFFVPYNKKLYKMIDKNFNWK